MARRWVGHTLASIPSLQLILLWNGFFVSFFLSSFVPNTTVLLPAPACPFTPNKRTLYSSCFVFYAFLLFFLVIVIRLNQHYIRIICRQQQ